MPINLLTDAWTPVRTPTGRRTIRPDQIGEPGILALDWPRADLNIACLEFLIGLVYLADPPEDAEDWEERLAPDLGRLRARLAPFAKAFELGGEGPRFLQDLERLEGDPNPPDVLFIDSSGGNTARNNADLFVRRGRYPALAPALAAMALYALQAHAPSGGKGNRTSMRGGGPMVTLVDPGTTLWDLVWANVPDGAPGRADDLPWMQPTRTSEKGRPATFPQETNRHPAEVFFGMPRRLRLNFDGEFVTGVIQKPWGTEYEGWRHPLTPYYEQKAGCGWLPKHPGAGAFGYRQWRGVVVAGQASDTTRRAEALDTYDQRLLDAPPPTSSILVAGWSMDNMKPREFILSREPLLRLDQAGRDRLRGMIEAAEVAGGALRTALKPVLGADDAKKTGLSVLHERFFTETEGDFLAAVAALETGQEGVAKEWLKAMRRVASEIFDEQAMPGLGQRRPEVAGEIVEARVRLLSLFAGTGRAGSALYESLRLESPKRRAA